MSSRPSASGVAPSSQKLWHRYIPRVALAAEAEPLAQAQRRARSPPGLTASSVAASRRCSALSKYVRTRPLASRSP